jgi:hypothetical protein
MTATKLNNWSATYRTGRTFVTVEIKAASHGAACKIAKTTAKPAPTARLCWVIVGGK